MLSANRMSSYSIGSTGSGGVNSAPIGNITPPVLDQSKALDESLNVVKLQAFHMKRCLVRN